MNRVHDILAAKGREVHTISEGATVYEAIRTMSERNVGALVVTRADQQATARDEIRRPDGGGSPRIAGIVTERDYLRQVALRGRTSRETSVADIMTRRVAFVDPSCPVDEALAIMTEQRCRHLPVLENGALAGLVSIGDCVRQIIASQSVRIRYLEDYIADAYPGPAPRVAGGA